MTSSTAKAKSYSDLMRLFNLTTTFVAFSMLFVTACSKQSSTPKERSTAQDKSATIEEQIYRTRDNTESIHIISSSELEYSTQGTIILCKYTKQAKKLRVVITTLGTTQVRYFEEIPNGFQAEGDGYRGKRFLTDAAIKTLSDRAPARYTDPKTGITTDIEGNVIKVIPGLDD